MGLLNRKSKDPELSDFWTSGITMLMINEVVELNPNWKLEKDGKSFRASNDGETLDTATLPGNFEYEKTILIQRNENITGLQHVAEALRFDIKNPNQVITSVDPNLDVDLTLIIGKDYNSISQIKSY